MWNNPSSQRSDWLGTITNRDAKLVAARKVAQTVNDGDVIGAGSGSTSFLALLEIGRRVQEEGLRCTIIPTSREIELTAAALRLPTTGLLNAKPHWCFDGADEVDANNNLIKGRGGALYREKLVMRAAEKTYILADAAKFVQRLGEKFAVPVEILPEALHVAETAILAIDGVQTTSVRMATGKDGPILTENGNFILDVTFTAIGPQTELALKAITGVLESGLFWNYQPEILS